MRILYVEDDSIWPDELRKAMGEGDQVVQATNVDDARGIFVGSKFDLVVVDDCLTLGSFDIDTLLLVGELLHSGVPIIAACSDAHHGEMLVQAGCKEWVCKSHLISKVQEMMTATA